MGLYLMTASDAELVGLVQRGDLAAWAEKITSQQWTDACVFFKHEDAATGPRLAGEFIDMVRGRA